MIQLLNKDAFEVLRDIEPESFDAVVTDPPYSSGGKSNARNKAAGAAKYVTASTEDFDDGTRDQWAHHLWSVEWMRLCYAAMKPGGWIMIFTDWRQLPLICNAVQCAGFIWQGINIWHKKTARLSLADFSEWMNSSLWAPREPRPAGCR